MKKAISLLTMLSMLGSVLVLSSCALFGVRVDKYHFPDRVLRNAVSAYIDKDDNGFLSKAEMEDAKILVVWGPCSDLSGLEYLTGLEQLDLRECTDLSGIEQLINLKTLVLSECPGLSDLSGVEFPASLEEIVIEASVFSETFVFDNEVPITNFYFKDCVFENGILFKNDSVEYIEFGYCNYRESEASGDLVFADCDSLYWFRGEFDSEQERSCNIDLSGCDNLDWLLISSEREQIITSVDLSDCITLSSFSISDDDYNIDAIAELSLDISGCPNIEDADIWSIRIQELDISDCPYLISAAEQTPCEDEFGGLIYESEVGKITTREEPIVFIK